MKIDVTSEQLELLQQLVDSRLSEIHPEIRRSRTYTVHDELRHDLDVLRDLQQRLHSQGCAPASPSQ